MKGIKLPKFRIESISFFCGRYKDRGGEVLEIYGYQEGEYGRIKTPKWLLELFKQAHEAGKRTRSKEIFGLLKNGDWDNE